MNTATFPFFIVLLFLFGASITSSNFLNAQSGHSNTYSFLELSPSARVSGLGGTQIAIMDSDVSLAAQNPALYNIGMNTALSLNTVSYFAGINHGYVGFAKSLDSLATFGIGIQYISYGEFTATDPTAQVTGTFSGGEYALTLGGAGYYNRFSYGANLKIISSSLEAYQSWGLAADLGLSYHNAEQYLTIGLVAKNIGTQLSTYNDTRENLPFDLQIGLTKRLRYLPFRFSITAHHLHQWDIRYDDPNQQTNNLFEEEDTKEKSHFADKLFRHIIFGGELYLGKVISIQAGYNHLRRQEMSIPVGRSLAGFSFGAGLQIKRFQVRYGRAIYHAAGGNHHFSFAVKFGEFDK